MEGLRAGHARGDLEEPVWIRLRDSGQGGHAGRARGEAVRGEWSWSPEEVAPEQRSEGCVGTKWEGTPLTGRPTAGFGGENPTAGRKCGARSR